MHCHRFCSSCFRLVQSRLISVFRKNFAKFLKMTISWFYTRMKWKYGWNSEKWTDNTDRPRWNKSNCCIDDSLSLTYQDDITVKNFHWLAFITDRVAIIDSYYWSSCNHSQSHFAIRKFYSLFQKLRCLAITITITISLPFILILCNFLRIRYP